MKKLFVLTLSLLVSGVIYAQKEPKGSPAKAESYLLKEDLESAKAEIDKAITIEKQAAKGGTWYTRGKVYQAIATKNDDDSAIPVALEAYAKVREIDPNGNQAKLIDFQHLTPFKEFYGGIGGDAFNGGDYDKALTYFNKALLVAPEDSTMIYYGSLAAANGEKYEVLSVFYDKMIDLGYADKELFGNAIWVARTKLEDQDKTLAVVKKAQKAFPDHAQYRKDEINVYLVTGKMDEAVAQLKSAIDQDPEDPTLHNQLALFYDNLGFNAMIDKDWDGARSNYNEAKSSYEKTLELTDNKDFVANYNLAVIYVNLAREHYDAVRQMDVKTTREKGPETIAKGNEIIKNALPLIENALIAKPEEADAWKAKGQVSSQLKMYEDAEEAFKKSIEFKPDDLDTWRSLWNMYNSTKQKDKADEAYAEIEKLEGGE